MAWSLAVHAVRMVFQNFIDVLKLTLVPFLLISLIPIALSYALTGTAFWGQASIADIGALLSGDFEALGATAESDVAGSGMAVFGQLVTFVVYLPLAAWLAIRWHRFVLAEEYPQGWFPAWPTGLVGGYIWKVILLMLAYFGLFLLTLLPVLLLSTLGEGAAIVIGGVLTFVGVVFVFVALVRWSIILPATSIGRSDFGFRDAWAATQGMGWTVLGALVVLVIFAIAAAIPLGLVFLIAPPLGIVANIALNWVTTVVGISFLTTLYGVAVEGRELT
ncbi:MAG: hypothetical protein ACU0CI_13580 [Shimia sp.]